jgi:hypothetical protein
MLDPSSSPRISLTQSAWQWWNDVAAREGRFAATRQLLAALWEFVRDSTPERRRQRFGDADYDWEHRVNTTSAAVGWRDRLLGVFHSPYQPTEAALFHEIIEALREHTHVAMPIMCCASGLCNFTTEQYSCSSRTRTRR